MKNITIISAMSENNVIGLDGKLPWHIPEDLKHFRNLTLNNSVIMGRKTFESIGRVLPKRENIVITRQKDFYFDNIKVANSLDDALNMATKNIYIIGGEEIYKQSLPIANILEITRIHKNYEGDKFFPKINYDEWNLINKINKEKYSFLTYIRK